MLRRTCNSNYQTFNGKHTLNIFVLISLALLIPLILIFFLPVFSIEIHTTRSYSSPIVELEAVLNGVQVLNTKSITWISWKDYLPGDSNCINKLNWINYILQAGLSMSSLLFVELTLISILINRLKEESKKVKMLVVSTVIATLIFSLVLNLSGLFLWTCDQDWTEVLIQNKVSVATSPTVKPLFFMARAAYFILGVAVILPGVISIVFFLCDKCSYWMGRIPEFLSLE
jgi:hypothetical protein